MSAQNTPGQLPVEQWDWDEMCRRQRAIAESSIGDDRAYEFECLRAFEKIRDKEAAIAKAANVAKDTQP
ncbi:hypothetical protein [Variovorax sp. PMC12]|uniref:hypothetical protein n=1 Tax=Variovorax sp. PMC12 TaxID=2126319 RepID=UPI00131DFDC4|nr:hypothetical protein [Variovorax sp. PMC12]